LNIFEFYNQAKKDIIQKGYKKEIEYVEERKFTDIQPYDFQREFAYVVCNSGMKNQIAEKIFRKYLECGISAIKHPLKKKAIEKSETSFHFWFERLTYDFKTDLERVNYLETLPHIGKTTKYHLARNIGLDVAKPDRHLVRIANYFDFDNVQTMCKQISNLSGDRIGTVDVVIWRYCNLNPDFTKSLECASPIPPNTKVLGILGGIL